MRAERYRIIEEIGEGYYARVARAWDKQHGIEVAIKFAKPFDEAQMKIHHEFSVLSRFDHPNVLKVFDFEGWGKNPHFTSEYVPGVSITSYFKDQPLTDLPTLMAQLLAGLSSIHAQGYLHLDLKPDNILVIPKQNSLKILDLGFAELISEKSVPAGTLGYLAPEILERSMVDYRADLYSIGVILYQIYTGRPPFNLESPISTLKDQLSGKIPEPKEVNPKVRSKMNNLIIRLLDPDPMARPSTCHELYAELETTFRRRRRRSKKKKKITIPETGPVIFSPGLVGRQEVITAFNEILPLDKRSVYAILGMIGIGKTRLLNHLAFKVQLERIRNLRYIPSENAPSLFQRLVEHLNLTKIDYDPDDRHLAYEKVFRAIRDNLPFALIIDDMESLSKADLEILRYIVFGFDKKDPFLLLVAGEEGEWTSLIELLSDSQLHKLTPFDKNLIEEILTRVFGVVINSHWLANWIYQKTGGKPSSVLDIINLAFRIGIMKHTRGGWEYDPVRLESLESPESLIEPTIDSLSDEMRFAVEALMVSSGSIPTTAIYLALRGEEVDIGREFRKLWFVEEVNTTKGSSFRIRGETLRKKMANKLAKKKRSDTAAMVLKTMENTYKEKEDEDAIFTLADLAIEAHLLRKIRVYCNRAAKAAYKNFLFDRALKYYQVLKEGKKSKKVDEAIGDCYRMLGDPNQALEYYEQARDSDKLQVKKSKVLRSVGRNESALEALAAVKKKKPAVLIEKGAALTDLKRFGQAKQNLDQAIKLAKKRKKHRENEFKGTYYLGRLFHRQGKYQPAKEVVQRAVKLGKGLNPEYHASALILYGNILESIGEDDSFQEIIEEAKSIVDTNGLLLLRKNILDWMMRINHKRGDLDQAARYAREFSIVMERIGNQAGVIKGLIMEGVIAAYQLDVESARKTFDRSITLAEKYDRLKARCLHNQGWLSYQCFDYNKAAQLLDEAIDIYNEIGEQTALNSSLAQLAIVKVKQGEVGQAVQLLTEITEQSLQTKKAWLSLLIAKGEVVEARNMLKDVLSSTQDLTEIVLLRISEARLEAADGNLDKGVEILKDVLQDLSKTRHKLYYLRVLIAMVELIVNNNGHQYLDDFNESLDRIEGMVRGKGLAVIKRKIRGWREDALRRLVPTGIQPEIGRVLRRLAHAVNRYMGGAGIFTEILDILINAIKAERGIIFLRSESGLKIAAGRGVDEQTIVDAGEFSTSVLEKIDREPIVCNDALGSELFRDRRSVQLNKIRSLIAAPLVIENRPIGALYLDSRVSTNLFTDSHLDLLIGITPLVSTLIEKSRIFRQLQDRVDGQDPGLGNVFLITKSKVMEDVYRTIDEVADSKTAVLLIGETGVGKGLMARLIHEKSRRSGKFIPVNCGAIPETLFESEIFGYKKGAFTDARSDKAGLIEAANHGSLFLDEVTAIPFAAQTKLLQVLEEGKFRRLGETDLRSCDIRLICATNRDIEEEIDSGKFRKDLYYRINIFQIRIPPLRERPEDIKTMAEFFLTEVGRREGRRVKKIGDDVLEIIQSYPWPGNIRELNNLIQRAVILSRGEEITAAEFMPDMYTDKTKKKIVEVLRDSRTVAEAAKRMEVSRRTFYRMLKRHNIDQKKIKK